MADIKALTKRESQLHSMLDLIDRFINNYKAETEFKQIGVRLDTLEMIAKEFYEVRSKIELLQEKEQEQTKADKSKEDEEDAGEIKQEDLTMDDPSYQAMVEFDDRYSILKADLLELRDGKQTPGVTRNVVSSGSVFSKVKLPEIKLPSFSGKVNEWVTFRDTFQSLIHNNVQLTSMDKFTYLRSSLTSEALQEISSIEFAAANYDVAWVALQKRYEIKKLIVKAYLDAIFSLEPLKKESYDGLSHLISQFEKNLLMLQKVGEDTAGWSTILGYMICSKLDSSTLRLWETHYCCNDVPSYDELIVYLRKDCSVLQSVAQPKSSLSDQQ